MYPVIDVLSTNRLENTTISLALPNTNIPNNLELVMQLVMLCFVIYQFITSWICDEENVQMLMP